LLPIGRRAVTMGSILGRLTGGVGWLTALAVGAVAAINIAGIGAIAVARRGVVEEAERILRLETASRARSVESTLASARADLAFLTGSPIFFGLESALASRDPRLARWRRLEAEGALLLFLRGHPEVVRMAVRSEEERPLIEAARRGGVPVLWLSPEAAGPARRQPVDAVQRPITGIFAFTVGTRRVEGAVTLQATIDAARLLVSGAGMDDPDRVCLLEDGRGARLAASGPSAGRDGPPAGAGTGPAAGPEGDTGPDLGDEEWIGAAAPIVTEGWSAPSPWRLRCARRRAATIAPLEPFAGRYAATLRLNLAVMSLALLLGAFAIQQARRRQRLELLAREEARVRELERQLFHAERLSTVGRLAAGIAHEINNPLEGMSNYLGLARDDLDRGDAAAARRRLDGVQEGLLRAVGIVRRVLAIASPGGAPRAPVDLNRVAAQSAEFVRSRPEFARIRFDVDLAEGPLMVQGSEPMIGQVLLNLLLNACEAQPQGGEVMLRSRLQAGRAEVRISDRGPGVPPADAARIFEPFYSTKESIGLGLSICYAIVGEHGGTLAVEPREGGGSIFVLGLPAAGTGHD
jgi:signal transduction histidine kinase